MLCADFDRIRMHAAAEIWAAEMSHVSERAEDSKNSAAARSDVDADAESDGVKRAAKCLHKLDHDISHLLTKLSVLSTAEMTAMAKAKSGSMLLRDFCETTTVVADTVCEVEQVPARRDHSMAGCSTATGGSARTTLAEFIERDSSLRDSDVIEDSDRDQSVTDSMGGTPLRGVPGDTLYLSLIHI